MLDLFEIGYVASAVINMDTIVWQNIQEYTVLILHYYLEIVYLFNMLDQFVVRCPQIILFVLDMLLKTDFY